MAGPIRIAILANGRQARGEIAGVATSAGRLDSALGRVGKTLVAGFAIDRIIRGTAALVTTGGAYVETLNKIQAITGSSNAESKAAAETLEKQSSLYAKMGETVQDAADGTLELSKSGLSLNKSLKAVYPTMVLAKSGQLEVADAASLVANTLNTFHLKASQATEIANDLANAADISSADVTDLAESFKYVAPLAAASHVSLAQTNAILALLANNGVKASSAGTGLRKFLASLQAPAGLGAKALAGLNVEVFDAQGKMRPLPALIDDLQGSLSKLTEKGQAKALRDIFGLQGVVPAKIILQQGSEGLAKYTKGVERADGAARLANATSKGLLGTLRGLRAEAVSSADAFYRKYSPAVDSALQQLLGDAKEKLPGAIAAVKSAGHQLEPVLTSLIKLAGDLGSDFGKVATGPMGHLFVDALKLTFGIAKQAADFLDAIPAPIRQIGIEAAIAAAILPKLAAGVAATVPPLVASATELKLWSAAALNASTRSTALGLAALKIGPAARGAAGVGGMLALVDSTKRTSKSMGTLEGAAGGALLGFSLGGPIGAAIGAGAGGLLGLWQATKKSNSAFEDGKPAAQDYASSLDQVTGAATLGTRAMVQQALVTSDANSFLGTFGLSQRQIVSAVMGNKNALDQVNAALAAGEQYVIHYTDAFGAQYTSSVNNQRQVDQLTKSLAAQGFTIDDVAKAQENAAARTSILGFIGEQTNAWKGATREVRAQILAAQNMHAVYKAFPKAIATKIDATGITPTISGVARLAAKYGTIDKRHVKALIEATGAEFTVKQVNRVIAQLAAAGKVKVRPDIKSGVAKAADDAAGAANKGSQNIASALIKHLVNVKAEMPQLRPSVNRATSAAAEAGHAGSVGIGSAVKSGFPAGFLGADGLWSSQVRGAVAAAIAAGRAQARAHSPSEATRDLGHDLVDGLAMGIAERRGKPGDAFAHQISELLLGATGSDQINSAIEKLRKLIEKRINLKDNKAEKAREKEVLDHLAKQLKAYRAIGAQQDALQDGNYLKYLKKGSALYAAMTLAGLKNLTEARAHLQALQQQATDFAASIRSSFVDFGNVTQLGLEVVTPSGILAALRARAEQADEYAALIDKLRAAHLNQTSLQQLIDAGPEQGLSTAEAIVQGGDSAIAEINQLTARIDKAGTALGQIMSDSFYAAGIAGAQGLVTGLESQQTALDRIARKLAHQLIRSIKDELGIKSPSTVAAGLMTNFQRGLGLGVDDVYVRRQGARIAASVVTGFGTPTLGTYLGGAGTSSTPQTLRVVIGSDGLHQLQRGREIQADLDAWGNVGGVSTVTVQP